MPHLVILYTKQLDDDADMTALCRQLADFMCAAQDEAGKQVFPTGGVRVLAYPAPHYAVADGGAAGVAQGHTADYGFVYLNLRMGKGRSAEVHQSVGEGLSAIAKSFFAPHMAKRPIGVTLQIDVGPEVYDSKTSTLHPLFAKS